MIDKKVLQIHFSRNAVNYDKYANVQKKMAHELLSVIDSEHFKNNSEHLKNNSEINILDIGCGTGYLTEKLLGQFPKANITAVDIAPGMIDYAQQKFNHKNIKFLCTDIEDGEINGKFDLIISNATFQWLNQLEKTIVKLCALLNKNGMLAFSTFGNKTLHELRQAYEIACDKLNIQPDSLTGQRFFSCDDLNGICQINLAELDSSRYRVTSLEKYEYEFFDTVRGFLDSVKKIGANNSNSDRTINLALTREMIKAYETVFKEDNKIKATYHCVFLIVSKWENILK